MTDTRQFEWNGHTIVTRRPRNRDRENVRQLLRKLRDIDISEQTKTEFVAAVCYTASGDEGIWKRPDPTASLAVLEKALESWLDDVAPEYTDQLVITVYQPSDPVTGPEAPVNADPNS